MPLPKLSPLQSRLAASLIASLMLLMLYFAFSNPHFAYAADVDSIRHEDHNHERLLDTSFLDTMFEEVELRALEYEADFVGFDRGIIGRQASGNDPDELMNNVMIETNVEQGQLKSYMFSNTSLYADPSPSTPGLPSAIQLAERGLEKEDRFDLLDEDEDVEEVEEEGGELKLRPRQDSPGTNRTLYITVTACSQPSAIKNTTVDPPPQLRLYVSQSRNNTTPGPSQDSSNQDMIELENGYGLYMLNATGDVYIGVYGENTTDYKDVWSAQIAASIDAPFHYYHNTSDPNLFVIDSDSSSALLATDNLLSLTDNTTELYEAWLSLNPPFVMFSSNMDDSRIIGVQNSYCGLKTYAQFGPLRPGQTTSNIQTGMTNRGVENLPKQQFYMDQLQAGSKYNAILAMNGNSTNNGSGVVGGGGQVFQMANFSTLTDGNCAVIFNLSFCSATAYAVPSNPFTFPNMTSLAAFYDNYTQEYYDNFKKVLAQIPCDTTSSAQYSLARTCAECELAYKSWLCSVSIPRCTDYTSDQPWLVSRAMGQPFPNGTFLPSDVTNSIGSFMNNSRNAAIDQTVVPGPYKEVLPCDDLCYDVVQSCPAAMGFGCPLPNNIGFNQSYGIRPRGEVAGDGKLAQLTCNYPGAGYYLAAGSKMVPSRVWMATLVMGIGWLFL